MATQTTRAGRTRHTALLLFVLAAIGCESDASPTDPNNGGANLALNAIGTAGPLNGSSTDTLIHFSFATGKVVSGSADWDIAFRRYEVRLNGGVSGTKGVLGYSMGNNRTATNDQVLAFTVDNTLAAFDAVRDAQIPADASFVGDRLVEDNTGYLNLAGIPSANSAAYWKVRTASGGYALMRITAIALSQSFALQSLTIESRLQPGTMLGAASQFTVTPGGATVAVSLATNAVVTATGCNWDLQLNPQTFALTVNTACNAGTYPGPSSPAFAAATAAGDAPQYGAFLSGLTGPVPNSIDANDAPFRYNLTGNNRLSPAFNTYLIKSGANVFKVQVINYYDAAGASGWPTVRYARIR